ncbi:MAG: RNA polymerase sigma factor [bacterium]
MEDIDITKFISGNHKTYEKVYQLLRDNIFIYFVTRVDNRETALDLTAEVFLRVYKFKNNFENKSSLKTWIFSIAQHLLIDFYRKNAREKEIFTTVESEILEAAPEVQSSQSQEDLLILEQANSAELNQILANLTPRYKNFLILKYLNNLNFEEISDLLNIKLETCHVLHHRALQAARKIISH